MKYILSGGGTGGHIYPALAIGEEIKKKDKRAQILYVGKKDSLEEELAKKYNFDFEGIDVSGLPRKKLNKDTVITFFNLMKGLNQCTKILDKFKPDIVIGTGGYVCGPIVFKAQQKKIKTVIQEQNAYPGKTNKILAKKADFVFINFMEAKKYLDNENIIFTGNPVRDIFSHVDREESRKSLNINTKEKEDLMESFFNFIDKFFSINVFGNLTLYQLISTILKYVFVVVVFYFIYSIIRIIYYDVRTTLKKEKESDTYLKLLNRNDGFRFIVQEYYFIGEDDTIGRDERNTICIKDKYLSKFHARIIQDEDIYFLEDLKSANGTYLNDERIYDAIELKSNDIIHVGQLQFLFIQGEDNE